MQFDAFLREHWTWSDAGLNSNEQLDSAAADVKATRAACTANDMQPMYAKGAR